MNCRILRAMSKTALNAAVFAAYVEGWRVVTGIVAGHLGDFSIAMVR